jgi:hypothetical protein
MAAEGMYFKQGHVMRSHISDWLAQSVHRHEIDT